MNQITTNAAQSTILGPIHTNPIVENTGPVIKGPIVPPIVIADPFPILNGPTTRYWLDGHNGDYSATLGLNWTPNGAPVNGDTLWMSHGRMDIQGNDLAGNTLNLGNQDGVTQETLNVFNSAQVNLDTAPGSTETVTANVTGAAYVNLANHPGSLNVTFNIDPNGMVQSDTFNLTNSSVVSNSGMAFINAGAMNLHDSSMVINTDFEGTGKIVADSDQIRGSLLEFSRSVSSGQDITIAGDPGSQEIATLRVDNPLGFGATVHLDYAQMLLKGVQADSYSYDKDAGMFNLYQGNNVVDSVRLYSPDNYQGHALGFSVHATSAGIMVDNTSLGIQMHTANQLPLHA